jgi:hypothetical protein
LVDVSDDCGRGCAAGVISMPALASVFELRLVFAKFGFALSKVFPIGLFLREKKEKTGMKTLFVYYLPEPMSSPF